MLRLFTERDLSGVAMARIVSDRPFILVLSHSALSTGINRALLPLLALKAVCKNQFTRRLDDAVGTKPESARQPIPD